MTIHYIHREKSRRFPLMVHQQDDAAATKEIKIENTQSARTVLSDSPCQRLSINSSLNSLSMKFRLRLRLSVFSNELNLFRISAPKFFETIRKSPAELIRFLTRTMLMLYSCVSEKKIVGIYIYIYIYIYIFIYEGWNFNSDNYLFTTDTK